MILVLSNEENVGKKWSFVLNYFYGFNLDKINMMEKIT